MVDATAVDTEQTLAEPSYLEMSDEDLMKLDAPAGAAMIPGEDAGETTDNEAPAAAAAAEGATDKDGAKPSEEVAADASAEGEDEVVKEPETAKEKKDEKKVEAPQDEVKDDKPKEAPAIDYKAEYERLTGSFKANGRDIKVDNVDDAIALMQMGANYNKKMAALKPNLKLMKLLENNGLLSDDKIGFLIDLAKKDPGAINKLVQDSGMDPMDLAAEKASAYKQTAYAVDDREIELDTVLDELRDSPAYTRTLDVVSNKWDVASKQVVAQQPQLLKVISGHVANGIYDLISTEIERERVFGRLKGLSDIEAYRQVGDAIQARGGFDHLAQSQGQPKSTEPVIVQPKPKVEDDKLKDKRRAASSTKPAAPGAAAQDYNPLSMSDEEFAKLATPKFG